MNEINWAEISEQIKLYCKTLAGQQHVDQFQPAENKEDASQKRTRILDLKNLIAHESLSFDLSGVDACPQWLRKVKKNQTLQILDLKDIRVFLEDIYQVNNQLKNFTPTASIKRFTAQLFGPKEMLSYINSLISPNGEIKSDASETLFKSFQEKKHLTQQIQSELNKIVKDNELEKILQDRYVTTREGRLVLPVISGMRHSFKGIIHDSSQSKQTIFVEPQEVVQANNKTAELEIKIQKEIEKLLKQLSDYIYGHYESLLLSYQAMVEFDAFYAFGFFANLADLQNFNWSTENKVFLPELQHPLLKIEIKNVVANTIELDSKNRILILSGPNAGGKTVLLKSIGLACLMAKYGLPLCASPNSEISFFDEVFVSIGDEQNLEENLSSFGGHLVKLNQATELKGHNNLILIDEICGTTEAQEGSALARAFIEEYQSNQVFAVITSHLAPLRSHWSEGVINGSMQYDPKGQQPTFSFVMGLPGESLALPTAKRYGVKEEILKRALSHLTPEALKKFSGLEEIESTKNKLIELQNQYKNKLAEVYKKEELLKKQKDEIEHLKTTSLDKDLVDYQKQIEDLIKFEKIKSKFDNQKNLEQIKQQMPKILKFNASETTPEVTPENFDQRFPAGTAVHIKSLNRKGIVQSKLNSKNEVSVLSESMRVQVNFKDILPSSTKLNTGGASKSLKFQTTKTNHIETDITEKTVDVRGKTVDEALNLIDLELDQALQRGVLRLKIVHGHGEQDRLKKSIRTFLSRNTFIKAWLSGKAYMDSDGVTVAEILS